jgi:hypothetical protein
VTEGAESSLPTDTHCATENSRKGKQALLQPSLVARERTLYSLSLRARSVRPGTNRCGARAACATVAALAGS